MPGTCSLRPLTGDIRTSFNGEYMIGVGGAIRAACDKLEGLEDGLVGGTAACQKAFDLKSLADRLNLAQVDALTAIVSGAKGPKGAALYSGRNRDPWLQADDWRNWKIERVLHWDRQPIIAVMGAGSLAQISTVPPTTVAGTSAAFEDFLFVFDLERRSGEISATSAEVPESPMQLMAPPHPNDRRSEPSAAQRKPIVLHEVADPVFPMVDTAVYHDGLDANNVGKASAFARFYPVPGMSHGAVDRRSMPSTCTCRWLPESRKAWRRERFSPPRAEDAALTEALKGAEPAAHARRPRWRATPAAT